MTARPRHLCAIAATILLVAVALSCNTTDVTRPRLTLKQLTVGVPVLDTLDRGAARVYSLGVSPGVLYRVSITGLSDDVDLYVFGSDSSFRSTQTCLIDRTIFFNTTPEDCTLVATSGVFYLGVDGTFVAASRATYTVEVQPATSATRRTLSVPVADTVAAGGANLYAVAVSQGTSYTVSITGLSDSAASLNVAAGGGVVDTSFTLASPKDFTIQAPDTVLYFAVDGFNDAGPSGSFVIMATPAPVVVKPIVGTSGSVPAATPTIGWVQAASTSQYHTDGLAAGNHTVSIVGLTATAVLHVYTDATYATEAPCASVNPGPRECIVSGPSAYYAVAAGATNTVGAGYIMLVW
jgi:hypothetical protein